MVTRKIKEIMTKDVITAKPKDTIKDIIKKLSENDISGLPVVDSNNNLIGIVSETDILQTLRTDFKTVSMVFPSSHALGMTFETSTKHREIKDAMKDLAKINIETIMKTDVITANLNNTISEVSKLMVENNVNRIPVTKNNDLLGIVTRGDIIRGLSKLK